MLSIIVPVYKVEKYIRQCIDSILAQTYRDFELILVDDGSPDKCPEICDEYAAKDPRIKVIHKENGGLRSALIAGAKIANGEYFGFVDSDDWIKPEMYETLMGLIKQYDLDCAMCNYNYYNEATGEYSSTDFGIKEGLYYGKDLDIIYKKAVPDLNGSKYISQSRWNKVFKKDTIYSFLIETDGTLSFGEDMAIVYPAFTRCRRIYFTEKNLYIYRLGIISITGGKYREEHFEDHWKLHDILSEYKKYIGEDALNGWIFVQISKSLHQILRDNDAAKNKRNALLRIMRDPRMRELLPKVKHLPMTGRNRIFYYAIRMKSAALLLAAAKCRKMFKRKKAK